MYTRWYDLLRVIERVSFEMELGEWLEKYVREGLNRLFHYLSLAFFQKVNIHKRPR